MHAKWKKKSVSFHFEFSNVERSYLINSVLTWTSGSIRDMLWHPQKITITLKIISFSLKA